MSKSIKNFQYTLKEWRTKKGLSQKEVGDKIGLSRSIISFLESGSQYPNESHIIKFKDGWGIDWSEYLVEEEDRPHYGPPNDSSLTASTIAELYNTTREVRKDLILISDLLKENHEKIEEVDPELKKVLRIIEKLVNNSSRKI